MAVYRCSVCGEIYDEEDEGVRFEDLPDDWVCPLCRSPKSAFVLVGEDAPATVVSSDEPVVVEVTPSADAPRTQDVEPRLVRHDGGVMDDIHAMALSGRSVDGAMDTEVPVPDGGVMDDIHAMALSGRSVDGAMDTEVPVPGFEDILFLGAQLARMPCDTDADVSIRTVIGKKAAKPMVIESPVYISHMSFGALSGRAKIALSKGSAMAGTAMCSGEGGALWDEMMAAHRYIFEYIPNEYSYNLETLSHCSAVEIKIGQGTKPGMGGHLPGEKVTDIIAAMRGRRKGEDIQSPSRFPGIESPEDLRDLVDTLRRRSGGLPIGVKIAAGHI